MIDLYKKQIKISKSKGLNYFDLMRNYGNWKKFNLKKSSPIQDRIPWTTFETIKFLNKIIHGNEKIFEFGCGGSTLFFLDKRAQVFSVEHDKEWFELTQSKLSLEQQKNWKGICHEPQPNPEYDLSKIGSAEVYYSEDERYRGKSFENYAQEIEKYPENHFDIVFVDGRSRPGCIKHSLNKVKINGYLILDNADRDYYTESFDENTLDGNYYKILNLFGPGPYCIGFWGAKVWRRIK
jgi:predicted O-methyltransferase YrrM